MEKMNFKIEKESEPKDISNEFLTMDSSDFRKFLRTQREEPSLSIKINWVDIPTARKLKAFLEDSKALGKQERSATIRATEAQAGQEPNVFESGVELEKI